MCLINIWYKLDFANTSVEHIFEQLKHSYERECCNYFEHTEFLESH